MRKRIGTKTYDTEKSEFICESDLGKIFRKKTGLGEYFACNEQTQSIVPLEYAVAKDLVKANDKEQYEKLFSIRDKDDSTKKIITISLTDSEKMKLRRQSSQKKMSMSEYVVWLVEQDEKRQLK